MSVESKEFAAAARLMTMMLDAAAFTDRFGPLLNALPDAFVVITGDDRIVSANAQALRLFGYPSEELTGEPIQVLVPEGLTHRPSGGGAPEIRGVRKDGSSVPLRIVVSRIDTASQVLNLVALRDMTDRKRLEEAVRHSEHALEAERRLAEQAARVRSELLASVSHELRTPLHAIIGFAELMRDGPVGVLADEQRECVSEIMFGARRLLHLVNELVELARVESGALVFAPAPVEMPEAIAETIDLLRVTAAEKEVEVRASVDPRVSLVTADAVRLKQVLYNYLSHALKLSTRRSQVTIRAVPEGESEFRVEVGGAGIDIGAEDRSLAASDARQLDRALARWFDIDVGLSFTRRMVEAQGGRVGVVRNAGGGCVIHAVLPRRA